MSEEMMIRHCSPTLAGMKTGNMFTCSYTDLKELKADIRRLNRVLHKKGLRVILLRVWEMRAIIYLYRPSRLGKDLRHDAAAQLLKARGYDDCHPERCIRTLTKRFEGEEFPHEVGLFLGYPPEDVCGFIENRAGGCKCVGTWKVYGNEQEAKKLFSKYKKCTDVYCAQHAKGKSLERLAVAG